MSVKEIPIELRLLVFLIALEMAPAHPYWIAYAYRVLISLFHQDPSEVINRYLSEFVCNPPKFEGPAVMQKIRERNKEYGEPYFYKVMEQLTDYKSSLLWVEGEIFDNGLKALGEVMKKVKEELANSFDKDSGAWDEVAEKARALRDIAKKLNDMGSHIKDKE